MDNRDNEDFIEELNALIAAVYSGGNSFAARKARAELQRRDDRGQFANMFGAMRVLMLLNGIATSFMPTFLGGVTGGKGNNGVFYLAPDANDPKKPHGFFVAPVDRFDGDLQAILSEDYLNKKGIDVGNPQTVAGLLNANNIEFSDVPPDFKRHPSVAQAFISEDGDITIEPDGKGGWDVIDNINSDNAPINVADLGKAMEAVHEIDTTRDNYVPLPGETIAPKKPATPVAEVPSAPEAPKADPAGMTNDALGKEVAQFERVFGGSSSGMDEATRARYDAVDAEWELRIDQHEDQFDNPDFIRDPSKAEATAPVAPVAEIPATEEVTPSATPVGPGVYFDPNRTVDPDFFEPAASRSRSRSSKLNAALRRASKFANDAKAFSVPGWSWKSRTDFDNFFFTYGKDAQGLRNPSQEQNDATAAHVDKAIEYLISEGYVLQVSEKNPSGTHGTIKVLAGPNQPYEPKNAEIAKPPATKIPSKKLEDYTDEEIAVLAEQEQRADTPRTDGMIGFRPAPRTYRDEQIRRSMAEALRYGEGQPDGGGVSSEPAKGGDGGKPPTPAATPASEGDGFNVTSDADLLAGDVADKIVDFIGRGDEQATDRVGNLYLATDIVDNQMQWIVSYDDKNGDTHEFVGYLPITTSGKIVDRVDVRAKVLGEIDSQSKENNATPTQTPVNVTDPQQLLEGDIFDTIATFAEQGFDNSATFGNVRVSAVVNQDATEGDTIDIGIEYTDSKGDLKEYNLSFPLTADGMFIGMGDRNKGLTARDLVREELQAQISADVTPAEKVTEILPAPELKMGSYNLNSIPSATELRRAKGLDGVSETDLQDALADAIKNGKKSVIIGGKNYSTRVLVVALSSRGFDTDMFIAGQLDAKNGNTSNVDALNAYRASNPDVLREGTDNAKPATAEEALNAFIAGTSQQELVDIYTNATQNGKDTVSIALDNFGAPEALGSNIVEIPLADFRKRLVDRGFDMDSVDDGFKGNDDAKKKIADEMGEDVVDLETGYRSDWRDVILSGSSEYSHIRFLDEYGVMQEFVLGEDGKWYDASKPLNNKRLNKGKDSTAMYRYIERNADRDEPIEITDGSGYDDSGDLIDEAKNSFSYTSPEEENLSAQDLEELSRWRHISYADLKKMLALQKAGVNIDIMDKMEELFPGSERRGNELVTETHEWTDSKGTKFKFEVVVTKTPNEYYYTYVRRIDTKTGKVQSARVGRMNQSALGLFRTYRREMTKFHHSFFKKNVGPSKWFESGSTKIRMKRDAIDPDTGKYSHAHDLQLDRNTTASVLTLLGATPSSTQEVSRASDLVVRAIFEQISKHRNSDKWMSTIAERLNNSAEFLRQNITIDMDYVYALASAYDSHIANQQALEFGSGISWDQRTPLEVGDTIEYVPSFKVDIRRRGKVVERLGFVDANGGYRYTDYIMVQWDNGKFQITTTRNNRLVETADGTDGSERVMYKNGTIDPRAGYATEATGGDAQELIPQPTPEPAPTVKPVRQTATRNGNSQLVLEDGTIVPEKPLGMAGKPTTKQPGDLVVGDFIGVLNDDLGYSNSPIVSAPVLSEDGTKVTVRVAIRQADGTYTIDDISFSRGPRQLVMVQNYPDSVENNATIAQMNEIFELLATKQLPDRPSWGLMNYYLGVMDGKDMSSVYSTEEVADIIQELRSLPNREAGSPIDTAGGIARALAEDAERNGNPDDAQVLGGLADAADIVASQTGEAGQTTEPASDTSLAGRVAEVASTLNLGSYNLKQDDRKALPPNSNPANVAIEGTSTLKIDYKGTKPTEEARALKDQMMEFGSEAWGMAQQRVVDDLRQRGYEGIKTYEDVAVAEEALKKEADRLKKFSSFSLGNASNFGYTEEDIQLVIKKMAADGYVDENFNIDYKKIRELGETLTSDAPGFSDMVYPYSRDGAALIYLMANSPDAKEKIETVLRNKKKAKEVLLAHREELQKFFKDVKIAHDKATIDTLKELGVEFDNVSISALGIRNSYGGSAVNETGEMGKAIQEAFDRVPRAILLQLAEIMQNNKMQLVASPFKGRGKMAKRSGRYEIYASREHGRMPEGITFQSAYENPYTDVFLHELWHVIQEVSPNVAQLEHAWLYDRLVSKDRNGNDILPKLVGANGGTRLGKEKGFSPINGFVSNYLLKQYGDREFFGNEEDFFSPNNKYSEVATMVMQDIFGHHGQSSSGDGMIVYASKHKGRAFTALSTDIFQDETTGKWYTDAEMTDEIKNAKTYGRPVEQFDEQVKHFGMGLLLFLSDWSPTRGLGSKSETKKYKAEDLFFDKATGKWYTDSSMTTEVPSADVIR
jgi:hypothetical protein